MYDLSLELERMFRISRVELKIPRNSSFGGYWINSKMRCWIFLKPIDLITIAIPSSLSSKEICIKLLIEDRN